MKEKELPLIANEAYLAQDIRDFVNAGEIYRLQKWMLAAGDASRATRVADLIAAKIKTILVDAIPRF